MGKITPQTARLTVLVWEKINLSLLLLLSLNDEEKVKATFSFSEGCPIYSLKFFKETSRNLRYDAPLLLYV